MEGVLEAMEVGIYFYTQDIVISFGYAHFAFKNLKMREESKILD